MRSLYSVRVTTTNLAAGVSHGADLMVTTVAYAFSDLRAAQACLRECEVRAVRAREYPGVTVTVDFEAEPSVARLHAAV